LQVEPAFGSDVVQAALRREGPQLTAAMLEPEVFAGLLNLDDMRDETSPMARHSYRHLPSLQAKYKHLGRKKQENGHTLQIIENRGNETGERRTMARVLSRNLKFHFRAVITSRTKTGKC
jgi:hypothetical protein